MDLLGKVDALVINETEIRQLTECSNLITAGKQVLRMGPSTVVIKKGEHGALLFHGDRIFAAPAFPIERVFDPTGAGDTFAGGFVGWLDRYGKDMSDVVWRQGMIMGTVMASFVVEDFSFDRMKKLDRAQISGRWQALHRLSDFHEGVDLA